MTDINGKTTVCGIIGNPVEHSLSPVMHNAAFRQTGLNWVYVPFRPAIGAVETTVAGIRGLGIAGVNVTVPFKEVVIPFMDDLTDEAVCCGAVNTIINRGGKLTGHNTDGSGFIRDLREEYGFDPSRGPALVWGAGGSARAVVVSLLRAGCNELALVNRGRERALDLARAVYQTTGATVRVFPWVAQDDGLVDFTRRAKLLVNCTSVGLSGQAGEGFPLPDELSGPSQMVYDLIYNPPRTPLLTRAEKSGAVIANGLGMLLHQGALSFEAWTGRRAPLETMRRALGK
ncbi:MAG: shikimate dehydrogenase [Firmicutes bacterium]|nr:shikimate dehydrogenase [Bacillota bacterium]